MPAILLVTSDPLLRQLVESSLQQARYEVLSVSSVGEAIRGTMVCRVSAVVLDAELGPDETAPVVEWLRRTSDREHGMVFVASPGRRISVLPIDPEIDKLIMKPVSPEQIRESVEAVIHTTRAEPSGVLRVGNIELDRDSREVRSGDAAVGLTQREFELLEYLSLHHDRTVPTGELLGEVWQRDATDGAGVVRSHVQSLRSKLKSLNGAGDLIRTFPRRGYRLVASQ